MKLDGYRGEIALAGGRARFYTRRGHDWSDRFPELMRAAESLDCDAALLDGEVVALDELGVSNFSMIQDAIASTRTGSLVYFAFDLLHLNGKDLLNKLLVERKAMLRKLIGSEIGQSKINYSEHIDSNGAKFFKAACAHGLEGIVSKRADGPYRAGRREGWFKVKCLKRQEFVVGGWLPRDEDPRDLAALLVGYFDAGKLLFAGKVGTGFNGAKRKDLIQSLTKIKRSDDPFEETPNEYRKKVKWAEPRLVVEVEFIEFTNDGLLRHPAFRGVREDKKAEDVVLEVPRPVPRPGAIASSKARWKRAR